MFSEYLFFLRDMLALDTVQGKESKGAPFGEGNALCLEKTLEKARELGFSVKNGDGYYGYAEVGEGELFGVLGHLDTVPAGNGWSRSPYGEIYDGMLYGRGVLDDKGPVLACLFAAAELLKEYEPKKKLRIIFGCNEESGWKCMEAYQKNEIMPNRGFSPDADFPVINCEKGIVYYSVSCDLPDGVDFISGGLRPNMVMAECAARTACDLNVEGYDLEKADGKILSHGKSAHGSTPAEGVNAFHKLLAFFKDEIGGKWESFFRALAPTDGSGLGIKLKDDKSGALTSNVGVVETEGKRLKFSLDIRYPVTFEKSYIRQKIEEALAFSDNLKIKETMCHAPLYVAPDSPLVKSLLEAYTDVTGQDATPISIGGGTYARVLPEGVAFGPIFPDEESTIHRADERASLSRLKDTYEIYKAAIKKLCF